MMMNFTEELTPLQTQALNLLQLHHPLTQYQMQALLYKPQSYTVTKSREYFSSSKKAGDVLRRLLGKKVIKRKEGDDGLYFYMPKGEKIGTAQKTHIEGCGDCFVTMALRYQTHLSHWQHKPVWLQKEYGIKPDMYCRLGDRAFYLEFDSGNEPISTLINKVKKYEQYRRDSQQYFYVVVIFAGRRQQNRLVRFLKQLQSLGVHPFCYLGCMMNDFVRMTIDDSPILVTHTAQAVRFLDLWTPSKPNFQR